MFRLRNLFAIFAILFTLTGGVLLSAPTIVHAQTDGLETVGEESGLGDEDLRIVIARIIRTILTFLGIIAVIIVLWGGFTWMTAGGDTEKVDRAKKILINGLIGLAIVLMSYAITTFVMGAILNSLSGGSGGSGSGGGGDGSESGLGGGSVTSFVVTDFSPEGEVAIRNIEVQITFSRMVDEETVEGNVVITNQSTGAEVEGTLSVSGNKISFVPSAACPEPNADRFCFDENTTFSVEVGSAIESTGGSALVCSGDTCSSSFTSGEIVDTEDPDVEFTFPDSGDRISVDASTLVQVQATDDYEIATADFYDHEEVLFDSVPAVGEDLSDVMIETTYYTDDLESGTRYRIEVTATDIAGNAATDSVSILATAAHCFNEVEDEDEEGEDCGGEDCGSCDGATCEEDSDCASGTCLEGVCVSYPEIESISPDNGAVGTYVTISGRGFGSSEGTIYFDDGSGSTVEATIPDCGDGWSDDEIIVEVPEGAGDGPITLMTSRDYEETTDDDKGAVLDDFDVNDTQRPNLCELSQDTGVINSALSLSGAGFGDSQGDSMVIFTDEEEDPSKAGSYTAWSSTSVSVTVPSVTVNDYYDVSIEVDGITSNSISFGVEDTNEDNPAISSIDPDEGGIGQYVTIYGTNFGASTGSVWFEHSSLGTAQGSIEFPDECSEDIWSVDEITIIVPELFDNNEAIVAGDYELYVESSRGDESEPVSFTITDDDPTPGICAVDPDSGTSGDTVIIYGDNFGSTVGSVEFYDGVDAATISVDDWSNDEVTVTVPSDAATGPLTLANSDGDESNSTNFAISDASDEEEEEELDGGYSWYFGTGEIPETPTILSECSEDVISAVPNEDFTDEVCVNATVRATFSTLMDTDTLNTTNIYVEACEDADCEDTSSFPLDEISASSSSSQTSFTATHSGFEASTQYRVTVLSDVQSEDGVEMDGDVTWEFVTGDSADDCEIEEVQVSPSSDTIEDEGGTTEYEALPVTDCQVLDSSSYGWTWSLGTSSYASVAEGACSEVTGDSCAVVTALAEGIDTVTAQENDSGIDDDATVIIDYSDPYVTSYWPSCSTACVNAGLGASFNIAVDDSIENLGMVTLYECANELCVGLTEVDSTTACVDASNCDEIAISVTEAGWDEQLTADTFFRVVISGSVVSESGVELTETNYGDDFSWIFSTRDDASLCSVSRLEILPDNYVAEAIGETVSYFVQPYGEKDACSVAGQRLSAYSYDYQWTDPIVDDADVGEWVLVGSTLLDVNPNGIPNGCTESCLATGSETYASICGDGVIGDGEDCDDGNVASGDGCSSACLAEGTNACSYACVVSGDSCSDDNDCAETCDIEEDAEEGTCSISGDTCSVDADCTTVDTCEAVGSGCCGDGVRDYDTSTYAYEECDDGNVTDGDGCSASCLNEGSTAVGATCGNGNIGHTDTVSSATNKAGGEDCDDGNRSSGDGCSSICLNEGSTPITSIGAECGDGIIDKPYETCDDRNIVDGDGCSSSCLREGSAGSYGDCGDGVVNRGSFGEGEDCDSSEGCSDSCLWEGSSVNYETPSVCGDAHVGTGELSACEDATYGATGGDGDIDPLQVVEIIDSAAEMVDLESRQAQTTIEVSYEAVSTSTSLFLSCVADEDDDCDAGYGPATNSCCMARPEVDLYPNSGNACRNAALYGLFTQKMDLSSFFYTDDAGDEVSNMYLALDTSTGSCPSSHTTVAHAETATVGSGWLARAFYRIGALFGPGVVQAQSSGECIVEITGLSQTRTEEGDYKVVFHYDTLLEANEDYTIHILGDDVTDSDIDREGALSFYGVEMDGDTSETFTTYEELCLMDLVEVTDVDEGSPGVYTSINEAHDYEAAAYSYQTGTKQQIEPISSVYDWGWTSWSSDDVSEEILAQQSESSSTDGTAAATYSAAGENGEVNIAVTATITTDVQSGTEGESHSDTTSATAIVCENPWPSLEDFPFIDDSTGTGAGAEEGIAWMNFSTYYCRDEGADDNTSDDLPEASPVLTEDIETSGVIKEYFLRLYDDGDATGDTIGIRIAQNEEFLSPAAWYKEEGFSGAPQEVAVANLPAVQDGRTTYIAFANRSSSLLYSNMFIISYNSGASQETIDIYNQLLSNLSFNTDMEDTGLCIDSSGSYTDDVCSSDQDCDWANSEVCGDDQGKIQRDLTRLTDVTDIVEAIEDYGESHGYCSSTTSQTCTADSQCPESETCEPAVPTLRSGSFVAGLTSSAWSSWNEQFASELGVALPSDPINGYVNCGEGTDNTAYDADTCVNQTLGEYLCPLSETNVYHYRAYGPGGYYLGAELEYRATSWNDSIDQDISDDANLRVYARTGSGDGFVGTSYFCNDTRWGAETSCGDGVIGGSEVCEVGDAVEAELCDYDGDGTADDGSIAQVCASDCLTTEDDPAASCKAFECGNGVVDAGETCDDGSLNGSYGYCDDNCTYTDSFSCGDGSLAGGELCDCGSSSVSGLNYGGSTCTSLNGTYGSNPNTTCAWNCAGPASFCGDGKVNTGNGEQCDGNTDSWDGELCVGGSNEGGACDSDDDCDGGGTCGDTSYSWSEACETTTVCLAGDTDDIGLPCTSNAACDSSIGAGDGVCSTSTFPTTRTITCADDGDRGDSCTWNSPWSDTIQWEDVECRATSDCGNGEVDEGEECDDGNSDATDACTNECQANVCGDGYLYAGEEQCDEGGDNGEICEASYGSTCSYCSDSCNRVTYSGAFCGNNVIEGAERCDGTDLPYWYAQFAGLGGSLMQEGNLNGICDREDEGSVVYNDDVTEIYVCIDVGVCNGGGKNGLICEDDTDCESDDGDGACVNPACTNDCSATCPFTYENDQLLAKTNELGASRDTEVTLISYDADTSGSRLTSGNAATLYIPACTAATRLTADIEYDFDRPETRVIFATDLSGSMQYVWDGTCADDGSSCHYDSNCASDGSVACEGETRMDTTATALRDSIDGLFDGLGNNVGIGLIGFTSSMDENYSWIDQDIEKTPNDASDDPNLTDYVYVSDGSDSNFFYTEDDRADAKSEVSTYSASGGTYTYYGLYAAGEAFDAYGESDDREVIVLMTDGLWSCEDCGASQIDPALAACRLKDEGVEIYTVALYSGSESNLSIDDDFCENYQNSDGTWMDEEEWAASLCGNGVVDDVAGEECDDGNSNNNDACTNSCTSAVCGDGVVQSGEVCDDGGDSATCDSDCTAVSCGDGYANSAAGEDCDETSSSGSGIRCTSSCSWEVECCSTLYSDATASCWTSGAVPSDCSTGTCSASACGSSGGSSGGPSSGVGSSCDEDGVCELGEDVTCSDCGYITPYAPWISPVRISLSPKDWKLMSVVGDAREQWVRLTTIPYANASSHGSSSSTCADDYADLGLIDQMACWSSGNPSEDNDVDYAHNGTTSEELESIYEEIVNSIISIRFTYVVEGETVSDNVQEGEDVELPWPEGFDCDGESSQEIPIRISFEADDEEGGTVTLSDIRLRYCSP